jgi:glyoxylase-like metal-dependent hydrolase (beta-lactamase superfamily II)
MSAAATFSVFESAGGARIFRLPVEAFPNFWAYAYLVEKGDHRVLIDAGSGIGSCHANLLDGLQKAGLAPSDLTHIFLTHAHIDHYAGLRKLKPLTNAKIGVHELDLQTVAHHDAKLIRMEQRIGSFLAETGLAEEAREQILSIYRFSKAMYQSTPVDFTYDSIEMQLVPFEFIHLPGHCPGHVAIRLEDVVFCGDMVVERVTPHLMPESINPYSGLGHYLESLARFQHWAAGARLILNGHDDVITDLPAQIEFTRKNIVRRVRKAIQALAEPQTIEQVCTAVYGETSGYNQMLVIEKTGAYIEYLYEHGMIEIVNPSELEQGQPARYRRLKEEQAMFDEIGRKLGMSTNRKERADVLI